MINTSIPPPRITLLQNPNRPQIQQQHPAAVQQPQVYTPHVKPASNGLNNGTTTPVMILKPNRASSPEIPLPTGNGYTDNDAEETATNVEKEPEIKVTTILKRPASTPNNLALAASNGDSEKDLDPVESLKKREEEYAKVRLRILGSTGMEDENNGTSS